jgi:uncharacterized membrane protein
MPGWFTFFMTLHILFVIVAFGPTFAFPLIGGMVGKHPQHSAILTEVIDTIERRMTIPLAVLVPLLGVGLIYTAPGHIDLWKSEWLIISIVLYIMAFGFAVFVQTKNSAALVRSLRDIPPGPPPEGATGPPPHIAALVNKTRIGGMFLTTLVVVILILMVWRPGNCQGIC